jgi:hypothetical protein
MKVLALGSVVVIRMQHGAMVFGGIIRSLNLKMKKPAAVAAAISRRKPSAKKT